MYDLTKFASFKGADIQQVKNFFFFFLYCGERYALALNNGSGKLIETVKASYAEWGGGGCGG